MSTKEIKTKIKNKLDNENSWVANNPVLLSGELAISKESDGSLKLKVGDGTSSYNQISDYIASVAKLAPVSLSGSYNDLVNKPSIPSPYTLPTASSTVLGGVKVDGTSVTISNGVISSPEQTTISGNAGSATKLQTARQINGTNFDGTSNITIGCAESDLSWGGRNFSGSFGPVDACLISELGANRFSFARANGITIEYSRDSGATWTDYDASEIQKVGLFSNGYGFVIGKADSTNKATSAYQLRVTLDTGLAQIYTVLNKFCFYVSTNGSGGSTVTIQKALQATPSAFIDHVTDIPIAGWSGYNIVNTAGIITYGNTAGTQYQYGRIRFIFKCTSGSTTYNGLQVLQIMGFGGVGWSTPSTMAKTGHLYSYDAAQNANFPAQVTATSFNGNATSATKLQNSRTISLTGSAEGSSSFDGSANIEIPVSIKKNVVASTIGTTWVGSEAPYTQTITVNGVLTTSIISVSLPSTATKEQIEAFQALNWTDGGQTNNSITLKAWGDRNTIEVPIVITYL